jgi:starch phosphorylase
MLSPEQARIHAFKVVPSLPKPLEPLLEIARNLWWAWNPEAVELFQRIDRNLWRQLNHNPIRILGSCPQATLEVLAVDEGYLTAIRRVSDRLANHLKTNAWFDKKYPEGRDCTIAYFSAEFGLTECLQIYSGGLGILAGDHLKSSSELGLPLVGVGLLYRNGYFQQYLNADGWQQETFPELDFTNLPIRPLHDATGKQYRVSVDLPGRVLNIAVWEAKVGRIRLLLLDTNLPDNQPDDRSITAQLYGGDMELRIKQEIVLGIGGMRALKVAGVNPTVFHMNEGHAAFLALEHIRTLIAENGVDFDQARQAAAASHLFTTHTPVPAGIDRFPTEMIERYFREFVGGLKLDIEGLLALGRENVANRAEMFSMAVLAIRTSDAANGVAALHGKISREMWRNIWPGTPTEEVPIGHVTNGVHARTWLSPDFQWLFDRYLSSRWNTDPGDHTVWQNIAQVPDEELWRFHERRRQKLVSWLRRKHKDQLERRGANSEDIANADELFDHRVLTIGFARRFATYKRAKLIFRDPDRLMKLIANKQQPMQIVIAGKAHPADTQGKELIRDIVHFARNHGVSNRIVFVENYNMAVARYLVQGCDVWLNNPRRPMEASGTSGMKAALNGVLNLSILDGWWDEAWQKDTGWAIGRGETYTNYDYQDQVESQALYDLLEKEVVPMFYDRDEVGMPRRWVGWMKRCIQTMAPLFNSNRQVQDYTSQYYMKAHVRGSKLMGAKLAGAKELAAYTQKLRAGWGEVAVESINADTTRPLGVRQPLEVTSVIRMGKFSPEMVRVQMYVGPLDADGRITAGEVVDMKFAEGKGDGRFRYVGQVTVQNSGRHGFAVRVIPGHPELATPFIPGLIAWDQQAKHVRAAEPVAV